MREELVQDAAELLLRKSLGVVVVDRHTKLGIPVCLVFPEGRALVVSDADDVGGVLLGARPRPKLVWLDDVVTITYTQKTAPSINHSQRCRRGSHRV